MLFVSKPQPTHWYGMEKNNALEGQQFLGAVDWNSARSEFVLRNYFVNRKIINKRGMYSLLGGRNEILRFSNQEIFLLHKKQVHLKLKKHISLTRIIRSLTIMNRICICVVHIYNYYFEFWKYKLKSSKEKLWLSKVTKKQMKYLINFLIMAIQKELPPWFGIGIILLGS